MNGDQSVLLLELFLILFLRAESQNDSFLAYYKFNLLLKRIYQKLVSPSSSHCHITTAQYKIRALHIFDLC